MEIFTSHTGVAAPLRISNIDTDQLVPGRFAVLVTKDGYGDAMMHDWRADPDFVLNQPAYRDATILIADENFGTGSSREMAVWALQGYGIKAVIAPRFGDIFRGNSLQNGLLTIELDRSVVELLWASVEARPGIPVTADLVHREVRVGDRAYPFEFDDDARRRLLEGLDDISLTLERIADIRAYEAARRCTLPTTRRAERAEPSRA
ncbi:3-isopropylmalate dehydratase small subunit [Nocardia sp. CA2R105]|uniref:3-isopropylmalate dehydratase small subunit n=1 Tax=Nocardia coffeae TaxID=2873381 RepID=UPI001CA6D515|nr:3-isopropylmalate dehydratase small subunit [Nocardia coffeae]MBY8862345.1 3-isopropylmalate dehydratase small subunit [Nocardia coffeae]